MKTIIIILLFVIWATMMVGIYSLENQSSYGASEIRHKNPGTYATTTISASVDVDGSDNLVIATNTGRTYLRLFVPTNTNDVTIQLSPATNTLGYEKGIVLTSGGDPYVLSEEERNLWIGGIAGLASSSTSTVGYIEF